MEDKCIVPGCESEAMCFCGNCQHHHDEEIAETTGSEEKENERNSN